MKLNFKRYAMSILYVIVPLLILLNVLYIEIDYLSIIFTVAIIIAFILLFQIKNKYVRVGFIVVAILLFLISNNFENIKLGVEELTGRYSLAMSRYRNKINKNMDLMETEYLFSLVRLYLEIMIPCLFVVYKNRFWKIVYIDITIPFIALCLSIGKTPSTFEVYLMAFLYANLAMEKDKNKSSIELNDTKERVIKNIFINFVLVVTFIVVMFIESISPYERSEKFDEYKSEINAYLNGEKSILQAFENAFNFIINEGKAHGGMNNGKLGEVDEIEFSGDEIMKVEISSKYDDFKILPLYIKSFVGVTYTGNRWENADDEIDDAANRIAKFYNISLSEVDEVSAGFLSNRKKYILDDNNNIKGGVKITVLDEDDRNNYWPYYSYTGLSSSHDGQRERLKEEYGTKKFVVEYPYSIPNSYQYQSISLMFGKYPGKDSTQSEELSKLISIEYSYYEQVVKKYYLDIPESFEDIAEEIRNRTISVIYTDLDFEQGRKEVRIRDASVDEFGYESYIKFVKDYLSRCTYTLSPGRLNSNEDFVVKFLTETKEGYCSHFASAGTLIFRAMGIPARYVEGYVVMEADGNDYEYSSVVKDDAAHAWVEIYVRGVGWVPVDVTPASYRSVIENQKESSSNKSTDENTEVTTTDENTSEQPTTTVPEETTSNIEVTTTDKQEGQTGDGSTIESGSPGKPDTLEAVKGFIILAAILVILSLIIMLIRIRAINRQKQYIELINSDKYSIIFKRFEKQLLYILSLKKIKITFYESTGLMADKILKADEDIDSETAHNLAGIIIKQKYSNENVEEEEAKLMAETVGKINSDIYNKSNYIRKLFLYYIKCLYLSKK